MVRPAKPDELGRILEIYAAARRYMAENGNPAQWGSSYPRRELLEEDLRRGQLYVVTEGDKIHGAFVLALGEETAHGLGLSVRRMQFLLLGIAAVLAGAAVSFAGQLGFVGLIVPHLARRLVGGGNGILLPMCALSGAALVTFCDLAARLLFAPYELPVGILLSLIGGPFFLMLLVRQRGGRLHD